MATQLKRIEFKQRYPAFHQGLFIVLNSKRLPKDQADVNIGRVVSTALVESQQKIGLQWFLKCLVTPSRLIRQ